MATSVPGFKSNRRRAVAQAIRWYFDVANADVVPFEDLFVAVRKACNVGVRYLNNRRLFADMIDAWRSREFILENRTASHSLAVRWNRRHYHYYAGRNGAGDDVALPTEMPAIMEESPTSYDLRLECLAERAIFTTFKTYKDDLMHISDLFHSLLPP
ncbi:unnamed protein product [Soboliphyme baturini]|uniref:HTH CENPB-type domain-containing protein n=1 Tax=Soboliphyme baturini TaxID=241478 RepID=A0A183J9P7_9BILA|nr:unnamed protein product [Soboliphyme baturini]